MEINDLQTCTVLSASEATETQGAATVAYSLFGFQLFQFSAPLPNRAVRPTNTLLQAGQGLLASQTGGLSSVQSVTIR